MVKDSLLADNTEPTLNVALAKLLQQRELQALGEDIIPLGEQLHPIHQGRLRG